MLRSCGHARPSIRDFPDPTPTYEAGAWRTASARRDSRGSRRYALRRKRGPAARLEVHMRAVVLVLGLVLVASASWASTAESRFLSRSEFDAEIALNKKLAAYVARNGYPDAAEWRVLSDEPPWDDHEVTCYY